MLKRNIFLSSGRRSLLALLLACMLLGTAGCFFDAVMDQWFPSKGQLDQNDLDNDSAGVSALAAALPAPSTLVRSASSQPLDADVPAAHYDEGTGTNRVAEQGLSASFTPQWVDAATSTAADLAVAVYTFDLAGQGELATLSFSWGEAPASGADAWLLLADYGSERWVPWQSFAAGNQFPLGDVRPLRNVALDQFVIAVVITGTTPCTLDTLRLTSAAPPSGLTNIFFLHHSTGAGLVFEGDMRTAITAYNNTHGTAFEFWDHGYMGDGLTDPDGNSTGTNYGANTDYTDPPNLHDLWTGADADWLTLRTTILDNHEVIAFKSCFPASAIPDENELNYRKEIYLEMRDFFDTRLDKLFVVISTPPLRDELTNPTEAVNARAFANWLKSPGYLNGHPNVVCFDLFDALALPVGSGPGTNMLRPEYQIDAEPDNGHPNTLANQTVGPLFAQFLCDAAVAYTPPGP